jgi:hypothetical protein
MDGKDGGWNLSDLEKEIDSAVDSLLVKKGDQTKPAASPQSPPLKNIQPFKEADTAASSTSPQSPPLKNIQPFKEADTAASSTPPGSIAPTARSGTSELKAKLEEVEAQLLTLEWDLNAKHINNAIRYLQDLRKYSHLGNELEKVIVLIQKVLYQLMLDENKLTPTALKFLQKSWKAVKGMTDERFSLEIDKTTLVRELITEFQRLKIEEEATKGKPVVMEAQRLVEQGVGQTIKAEATAKPRGEARISPTEIDTLMSKLEKLVHVVNEERKRWDNIQQEIIDFKADLQRKLGSKAEMKELPHGEETDEGLEKVLYGPSGPSLQQTANASVIAVSLCKVSGVTFGLPEKQIVRSFPIKRWVSDSFIERGKVKLKNREIPLFNICKVFKLKPSTEENPLVLLIRGRENRPAAVIIDQAISREEMKYHPVGDRPYILGQGISRGGKVWILDAERISP